jgi:hypothetical protein
MANRTEPNPDLLLRPYVRNAAAGVPSATEAISRTIRTDAPLPDSVTEEELRLHAAEVELRPMRDRVRNLEQALRAAGRVLAPYSGGSR